jgi:hypothetical protein
VAPHLERPVAPFDRRAERLVQIGASAPMVTGPAAEAAASQPQVRHRVGRRDPDRLVEVLDRLEERRDLLGPVGRDPEPSQRLLAVAGAGVVSAQDGGALLGARFRFERGGCTSVEFSPPPPEERPVRGLL